MVVTQDELDRRWDFADPAGSHGRLQSAALTAQDAGDIADCAEWQTQVARALGLQERFAEADAILDSVDTGPARDRSLVAVRTVLERGRLRQSAGDPLAAAALFRTAADLAAGALDQAARSPSHTDDAETSLAFLHVDALHMLTISEPTAAERWTDEALAALESVTDARTLRWRVSLYNNLGWALLDAGRGPDAVAAFESARNAAVQWGTAEQVAWADDALAEARAAAGAPGGEATAVAEVAWSLGEVILYVADQGVSREFYRELLGADPGLDVPGMTEFQLSPTLKLGLMPAQGIARILGDRVPHPASGAGIPRCELYFRVPDSRQAYDRAIAAGAIGIDPPAARDWGDVVGYATDPDGHILAFATAVRSDDA